MTRSKILGYCSICGAPVYRKNQRQNWMCDHRGPASISTQPPTKMGIDPRIPKT